MDFPKGILTQIRLNLNIKPIVLQDTFKNCKHSPVFSVKLKNYPPEDSKFLVSITENEVFTNPEAHLKINFLFLHAAHITKKNKVHQQV